MEVLGKIASALGVSIEEFFKTEPATKEKLKEWDDEYENLLKNGMRIGKSVIFDNETDKIDKFFLRIGPVMGPFLIIYAQVMLELLE